MTEPQQFTFWSQMAQAADDGHLFLDPDAARNCSQACDNYIDQLRNLQDRARQMPRLTAFGDFDSGQQAAAFLSDQISGGSNSFEAVLQSHIDVVKKMQVVFQKFFTVTTQIDEDNATGIGGVGEPPK